MSSSTLPALPPFLASPSAWIRPLSFVALTGALVAGVAQLIQLFVPDWNGAYLIIICTLAALEGLYSVTLIKAQNVHGTDVAKFHAIELIGFLVLLKVAGSLGSLASLPAALLELDMKTLASALLLALFWLNGLSTGQDFAALQEPPDMVVIEHSYVSPAHRLVQRFFIGGIGLLAIMGVVNLTGLPVRGLAPEIMIYFVSGLIFLAQVRLDAARREWRGLGVIASPALTAPWLRAAAILAGLAALIALLLPTRYMLGLLDLLHEIVQALLSVIVFIMTLLFWLVTAPLRLLMGKTVGPPEQPAPPPPIPITPSLSGGNDALLSLLPKIFLLAIVGYIVYSYLRDNPEIWALLKNLRIILLLRQIWAALRRQVGKLAINVRAQLPHTVPNWLHWRSPLLRQPFGYIRLNSLSPRERIFYFYLSTLRRARDQGVPREPDETPYEYEEVLDSKLPDIETEVGVLTEAFVEARYSPHPVDTEQVQRVQVDWERLRRTLQQIKRQPENREDAAPGPQ